MLFRSFPSPCARLFISRPAFSSRISSSPRSTPKNTTSRKVSAGENQPSLALLLHHRSRHLRGHQHNPAPEMKRGAGHAYYDSGDSPAIRNPARQARLSRLIRQACTNLIALNGPDATAVGLLLARTATADIVDAHVVVCAQRAAQAVVTSDADDLRRIAPRLRLVVV